jgi:hypothetical protein
VLRAWPPSSLHLQLLWSGLILSISPALCKLARSEQKAVLQTVNPPNAIVPHLQLVTQSHRRPVQL